MRTPESPKTLYDKIFDEHVVRMEEDGTATLYIDRHLVHEVTSAQAFEGLRMNNRPLWRKSSIVATADHNTPTTGWEAGMEGITDPISKLQVTTLDENIRQNGCAAFFPFLSRGQGVIHVMGPEEGATLPGMTVVCGDSHTSTHGACAAIAFGIGTSEVEHVMATQTLLTKKMKNMRVHVEGKLQPGVFAKDLALYIIGKIGTAGGTGCAIEFDGPAIRALSMEGRMSFWIRPSNTGRHFIRTKAPSLVSKSTFRQKTSFRWSHGELLPRWSHRSLAAHRFPKIKKIPSNVRAGNALINTWI